MAEALNGRDFETEEEAIVAYFSLGIRHEMILLYLRRFHGFDISLRTLRRRLSGLNLRRHNAASCSDDVLREAVRRELATSGGTMGYRQLWHILRVKHNIHVCRRKVSHRLYLHNWKRFSLAVSESLR